MGTGLSAPWADLSGPRHITERRGPGRPADQEASGRTVSGAPIT